MYADSEVILEEGWTLVEAFALTTVTVILFWLITDVVFYGTIPLQVLVMEVVNLIFYNDWNLEEDLDYATRIGLNLLLLGTISFLILLGSGLTFFLTRFLSSQGLAVEANGKLMEAVVRWIYKPSVFLFSSIAILIISRTLILILLYCLVSSEYDTCMPLSYSEPQYTLENHL